MIVAAIWAITVLILCERISLLVKRWLVVLEEASKPQAPVVRDPIPTDLAAVAAQWGEPWARDQALAAMQESYDETGNWDAVRTLHGIGNS